MNDDIQETKNYCDRGRDAAQELMASNSRRCLKVGKSAGAAVEAYFMSACVCVVAFIVVCKDGLTGFWPIALFALAAVTLLVNAIAYFCHHGCFSRFSPTGNDLEYKLEAICKWVRDSRVRLLCFSEQLAEKSIQTEVLKAQRNSLSAEATALTCEVARLKELEQSFEQGRKLIRSLRSRASDIASSYEAMSNAFAKKGSGLKAFLVEFDAQAKLPAVATASQDQNLNP